MKILRLLWEIIFPFDMVRLTPKQQALRTPDHAHLPPLMIERLNATRTNNLTAVNVAEVLEPSEAMLVTRRVTILCLFSAAVFPSLSRAQAPVFEIEPAHSWIKFDVKASLNIAGKFDKWDATLTFTSPDETTGVLEIKIQAASVDTGSLMKNSKLKGKDFFDVDQNPSITFKSTKFVQTGPGTFEVDGNFTIRGVANPEKLTLTVSGKGTGSGEITGKMVFNRKDYGMNKGIPFIKIADHVDVTFHLKEKRVSGPPLAFKG